MVGAVCLVGAFAVPVAAQQGDDCYPDGCSPPSNPRPSDEKECTINRSSGEVGDTVRGRVSVVDRDDEVEIRFDGETVAERDTESANNSGQWNFDFVVPQREPGEYSVVAVGSDFSVRCATGNGDESFEVIGQDDSQVRGDEEEADPAAGGQESEDGPSVEGDAVDRDDAVPAGGGGFALPFTGGQTGLLVVAAALALAVGLALTRVTRRRRMRHL